MPQYRVCDIEGLIEIYPNAVIFLFRFIIGLLTAQLRELPAIGNHTLLVFTTYVAGIVVLQRKRTQTRIAREFDHVSHDQLWRLTQQLKPIRTMALKIALQLIQWVTGGSGWYILDDVLIEKPYARWMVGLYDQYDHTTRRHVKGIRLVVVLWTNGTVRVPVAFALWHAKPFTSKYRTKNQIARLLIYSINKRTTTLSDSYLVCDNWYASKQNLRFFEGLGVQIITRLRKNAWVALDGEPIQLKTLATKDPIASYHFYRDLGAYVKSYPVSYPKVGPLQVAVVKHDRHPESGKTKFLISRRAQLTNAQLVKRYRNRWVIEEFFRDCKQHFGIADWQARELEPLICHFQIVFSAMVLSDLIRDQITQHQSRTVGETLTALRSIRLLRFAGTTTHPIALSPDGKIEWLNWQTFLNPVRTNLSIEIDAQIPESIYNLT